MVNWSGNGLSILIHVNGLQKPPQLCIVWMAQRIYTTNFSLIFISVGKDPPLVQPVFVTCKKYIAFFYIPCLNTAFKCVDILLWACCHVRRVNL